MRIKKTITEEKQIEVDLTLPHFFKASDEYYKIIDERTVAVVMSASYNYHPLTVCALSDHHIKRLSDGTPITEEEFLAAAGIAKATIFKTLNLV
jgi:hypothetical protein